MKTITLPPLAQGHYPGKYLAVPVKVDWPELQLTDTQIIANAAALALGLPDPYPDQFIFTILVLMSDLKGAV